MSTVLNAKHTKEEELRGDWEKSNRKKGSKHQTPKDPSLECDLTEKGRETERGLCMVYGTSAKDFGEGGGDLWRACSTVKLHATDNAV